MSNDINALREVLFDTLRAVKDGSVDLDKAKAINETAQTIINTAKVEVDFMRQTGATVASGFLPVPGEAKPQLPKPQAKGSDYVGQPVRGAVNGNTGPKASI